jgi:shikimate kinase
MDEAIVAEEGRSIAQMVKQHGWEYFRRKESDLLRRLAAGTDRVIGTGGGIVLAEENVALLRSTGRVIWLRARVETIRARLAADPRSADFRPALTDHDPAAEIEKTLREREPLYRAAMHLCVDTDDPTVEEIVGQIKE